MYSDNRILDNEYSTVLQVPLSVPTVINYTVLQVPLSVPTGINSIAVV